MSDTSRKEASEICDKAGVGTTNFDSCELENLITAALDKAFEQGMKHADNSRELGAISQCRS